MEAVTLHFYILVENILTEPYYYFLIFPNKGLDILNVQNDLTCKTMLISQSSIYVMSHRQREMLPNFKS